MQRASVVERKFNKKLRVVCTENRIFTKIIEKSAQSWSFNRWWVEINLKNDWFDRSRYAVRMAHSITAAETSETKAMKNSPLLVSRSQQRIQIQLHFASEGIETKPELQRRLHFIPLAGDSIRWRDVTRRSFELDADSKLPKDSLCRENRGARFRARLHARLYHRRTPFFKWRSYKSPSTCVPANKRAAFCTWLNAAVRRASSG